MRKGHSPRFADLGHHLRERLSDLRANWQQFRKDLREDPSVLWRTQTTRILLYVLLGAAVLFLARFLLSALAPPPVGAGGGEQATRLATLYVACVDPACLKPDVSRLPMDFKAWPIACVHCGKEAAYRAILCSKCRAWFATAPEAPPECPHCARAAPPASRAVTSRPADVDDAEDGW